MGAIPCFIGDFMGNLVRVGEPMQFGDTLWLLTHADLRNSARVRAFMDHAGVELGKKKPIIEGRLPTPAHCAGDGHVLDGRRDLRLWSGAPAQKTIGVFRAEVAPCL